MVIECKGCGKAAAGDEYKEVGKWYFCPDCFQDLLKKEAHKPERRMKISFPEPPPQLKCHGCEKPLEPGQHKKFGEWAFCTNCYSNLMPAPPIKEPEEEIIEEEPPADIVPKFTPGVAGDKRCSGCNKRLVEGGYKTIEGAPFCPDCYYPLIEEAEKNQENQIKSLLQEISNAAEPEEKTVTPAHHLENNRPCAACAMLPADGKLKDFEGFAICKACLSSDPDTALQIARTRHRKHLQRLRDELNG